MQAEIQGQLEPLVGLKLSIARRAGSMRGFHFGNVRQVERGSVGEYALHIQCPWRIDSAAGILTGSDDLWRWAFGEREPIGWIYHDGNNLQDVRIGELLKGYDTRTQSYVNVTDYLVVEGVQVSQYSEVYLFLSGGYRLVLFPTSTFGEAWRLLNLNDDNSHHFVMGQDFVPDLNSESIILSLASHHRAAYSFEKGKTLEAQGDWAGALVQYNQAVELNPKFAAGYFQRAKIYQSQAQPERALVDLNEVIHLVPEHDRGLYEVYCERGNVRIDLEDFAGAILDLTQALLAFPKGSRAYFLRAMARDLDGDLAGAISDFTELIRLRPEYADAYDLRGEIYRNQDNFDQAIADFDKAIQLQSTEWTFYYHRGLAWASKGAVQPAVHDYRQALQHWPIGEFNEAKDEMLSFIAKNSS